MARQLTSAPGRGGGGERFAPGLPLGEARARLFALGGLGDDGGYGDAWDEALLTRRVGEVRRGLKLDEEAEVRPEGGRPGRVCLLGRRERPDVRGDWRRHVGPRAGGDGRVVAAARA